MINLRSIHDMDLEKNIKESDFFIVLASVNYFKSAHCAVQCELANIHEKKFIILARYNLKIPESFIKSIQHGYKIIRYSHINQAKKRLNSYIGVKDEKKIITTPYKENV